MRFMRRKGVCAAIDSAIERYLQGTVRTCGHNYSRNLRWSRSGLLLVDISTVISTVCFSEAILPSLDSVPRPLSAPKSPPTPFTTRSAHYRCSPPPEK